MIKYLHLNKKIMITLILNLFFVTLQSFLIQSVISKNDYLQVYFGSYFSYTFFLVTIPLILLINSEINKNYNLICVRVRMGYIPREILNVLLCVLMAIELSIFNIIIIVFISYIKSNTFNLYLIYYFSNKILLISITLVLFTQAIRLFLNKPITLLIGFAFSIFLQVYNMVSIDIKYGSFFNNPLFIKIIIFLLVISILCIFFHCIKERVIYDK